MVDKPLPGDGSVSLTGPDWAQVAERMQAAMQRLESDPAYRAKLMAMSEVDRHTFLHGDWSEQDV